MIATTDVGCKNLFAYAENNPVTGKDGSGAFIDTVFDVISLAGSIVDVCKNPTDPLAWIGLAGDVVDLIPGVSGVGEGAKALCGMAKVADATKGAAKATKAGAKAADDVAEALVDGLSDVGKKGGVPRKTYQTYTKTNPITGEVYSGRTSGMGTPLENIAKRDANHHMNAQGFGPAVLDKTSDSYEAIRGREQMLIDYYGHAKSVGGNSGNAINGIGPNNKKKDIYIKAAKGAFGNLE